MCGQKFGPKKWNAAQNREKHEWKNEEPKLDNARRLRGIHFIDPDDQDYKETLAMPCKRKARTSTTKVAAEEIASQKGSKNDLWLYNGIS